MPVIIQHGQSYLRASSPPSAEWSENAADAEVFINTAAANAYIATHPFTFSAGVTQPVVVGSKNRGTKTCQ
jgi:hypothetical protein